MPVQNKKYDGFILAEKRNGSGRISSFTININTKEAHALGFIDSNSNSYALKKEFINNTLVISRASENEKSVKLHPKKSHGYVSSYNLSISFKEALALDVVYKQRIGATYRILRATAVKHIVNDTLVVSRAFPQTSDDLYVLIQDFGLVGKHLSKKTLLDFLHFVEGDSESYFKQRDKIYDSVRVSKRMFMYQGQFCFFVFNFKLDKHKAIKSVFHINRTLCDYF